MSRSLAKQGRPPLPDARRRYVRYAGDLLTFAGPVAPYPTVTAHELTTKAWADVGIALRRALSDAREEAHGKRSKG